MLAWLMLQYDGAVSGAEHAVLSVPFDRPDQHRAFHVLAHQHEFGRLLGMVHTHHDLFDDRALVQVVGHEVRSRADQLDAPVERLVVGAGALEPGQERMVDVDGAAGQQFAGPRRQDLHVPGQNEQFRACLLYTSDAADDN